VRCLLTRCYRGQAVLVIPRLDRRLAPVEVGLYAVERIPL
jgi:hypothetical protein